MGYSHERKTCSGFHRETCSLCKVERVQSHFNADISFFSFVTGLALTFLKSGTFSLLLLWWMDVFLSTMTSLRD